MRISDWSSDVCSSDLALIDLVGRERARLLWDLGEEAKGLVKQRIRDHAIDCDLQPGVIHAGFKPAHAKSLQEVARFLDEARSEERRVGKGCVSACRSRWSPEHENKNTTHTTWDNDQTQINLKNTEN